MIHLIGELQVSKEKLAFSVNPEDVTESIWKLDGKEVVLEIKRKTKKRSINANNFFWKLCSLIAAEIHSDKDCVYEIMLKRYGQYIDIECEPYTAPKVRELFRISEVIQDKYEQAEKIVVRGYLGSHLYDTKEMSVLINGAVSECKEMGIDTWSKEEIDNLVAQWEPIGSKN